MLSARLDSLSRFSTKRTAVAASPSPTTNAASPPNAHRTDTVTATYAIPKRIAVVRNLPSLRPAIARSEHWSKKGKLDRRPHLHSHSTPQSRLPPLKV